METKDQEKPQTLHFLIHSKQAGERLDRFLTENVVGLSRNQAQQHIQENHVKVGHRHVKPSHVLREGEDVVYSPPPLRPAQPRPEAIPIEIFYEDEFLLVLNKQAGLVMHPAPGHAQGTLVNALLHHCNDLSGIGGVKRPGIVHRLDKDTSGLIVVAKKDSSHRKLSAQFQAHTIERRYLALVFGALKKPQGAFLTGHRRHPKNRKKFTTCCPVPDGSERATTRRAETRYRVLEQLTSASFVEAKLETGRTHQVRLHFAESGHPLVGDPVYGRPAKTEPLRKVGKELARQALHAAVLGFVHPMSGQRMLWISDLPADMRKALASLGGRWPVDSWPPDLTGDWVPHTPS